MNEAVRNDFNLRNFLSDEDVRKTEYCPLFNPINLSESKNDQLTTQYGIVTWTTGGSERFDEGRGNL